VHTAIQLRFQLRELVLDIVLPFLYKLDVSLVCLLFNCRVVRVHVLYQFSMLLVHPVNLGFKLLDLVFKDLARTPRSWRAAWIFAEKLGVAGFTR
jgi:hypothetical protein